ncbi:MAG: nuclear transport factor 2 family protein [Acidobacteriota bacterium]
MIKNHVGSTGRIPAWLFAALLALSAGVATTGSTALPIPDADQLLDRFREAYLARDAEKLLALYTEDAVFEDVCRKRHTRARLPSGRASPSCWPCTPRLAWRI